MRGMGEKKTETYNNENKGKNSPFGCPPIPPSIKLEADCFPGRKNRKQAGPTLGGTGALIYWGKEIQGRAIFHWLPNEELDKKPFSGLPVAL